MKMVDTPNCAVCHSVQDSTYIFRDCVNATKAHQVINQFSELDDPRTKNMVTFMINRMLYLNRNKKICSEIFHIAIRNRLDDYETLSLRKQNAIRLRKMNNPHR